MTTTRLSLAAVPAALAFAREGRAAFARFDDRQLGKIGSRAYDLRLLVLEAGHYNCGVDAALLFDLYVDVNLELRRRAFPR